MRCTPPYTLHKRCDSPNYSDRFEPPRRPPCLPPYLLIRAGAAAPLTCCAACSRRGCAVPAWMEGFCPALLGARGNDKVLSGRENEHDRDEKGVPAKRSGGGAQPTASGTRRTASLPAPGKKLVINHLPARLAAGWE